MNYTRIYNQLVERARNRNYTGYTERHHILPHALGGTNNCSNIVRLTAREHYIAHLCLVQMTTGTERYKMALAVHRFKTRGNAQSVRWSARLYEASKLVIQATMRERMKNNAFAKGQRYTHAYTRNSSNIGRYERTPEIVEQMRQNRIGKGRGEQNAMSDPTNRAKVAASKVGRRIHLGPNGERRYFIPGAAPEGYSL